MEILFYDKILVLFQQTRYRNIKPLHTHTLILIRNFACIDIDYYSFLSGVFEKVVRHYLYHKLELWQR